MRWILKLHRASFPVARDAAALTGHTAVSLTHAAAAGNDNEVAVEQSIIWRERERCQ